MIEIIHGDCHLELLKIPSESIDMVLTSPPYDKLREYRGNNTIDVNIISTQLYRILKKGGVVVWIVGDQTINGSESLSSFRQAIQFKENGFNVHDTMIYKKHSMPMTHRRYEQSFEYMFVFSKGKPKTFNPIKELCKYSGLVKNYKQNVGAALEVNHKLHNKDKTSAIKKDRIKGNVWEYSVGFRNSTNDVIAFNHPAIFPEKLVTDHILSWSNVDDIILDPFAGSGTTLKIARILNRKSIGIEINEDYIKLMKERLGDSII